MYVHVFYKKYSFVGLPTHVAEYKLPSNQNQNQNGIKNQTENENGTYEGCGNFCKGFVTRIALSDDGIPGKTLYEVCRKIFIIVIYFVRLNFLAI